MTRVTRAESARASARPSWQHAVGLSAALWLVAGRVHACPMCFGGNNQNQEAFLYGSLFMMIVPVVAIGSLLYWAYKRTRAFENLAPPPPTAPQPPHEPAQAAPPIELPRIEAHALRPLRAAGRR